MTAPRGQRLPRHIEALGLTKASHEMAPSSDNGVTPNDAAIDLSNLARSNRRGNGLLARGCYGATGWATATMPVA
jgi:hypothetical protein